MDDEARTFFTNYIIVACIFFGSGVILTIIRERRAKRSREWKRCVYGHWATRGEYCPVCGTYLAPVPEAQRRRIECVANHRVTRHAIADPVIRYHFALWLADLEQRDGEKYMIDVAITLYTCCGWSLHAQEVVEEG